MTNEEAISLLRQVKEAILNSNSWDETTNEPITDSFDMAIKALEDSRWIPVTERLPEEDGDYLVTTSSLYGATKYVTTRDFSEGRWTYDSAVTAWMPLPKPYEGSETE